MRRVIVNDELYFVSLGVENPNNITIKERIFWPVFAWPCVLPSDEISELDILQDLVLKIIDGFGNDNNVLTQTVGISSDLVNTVKEKCIDDGYIGKKGQITVSGKRKIQIGNPYEKDINDILKYEKVYVFRDGVSGDIIPNFSISNIPKAKKMDGKRENYLVLEAEKSFETKPSVLDITRGISIYNRFSRIIKSQQESFHTNKLEITGEYEYLIDEEEMDWTLFDDDGKLISRIQDKGNSKKEDIAKNLSNIKIWDNIPSVIYLETYICIDPDRPNDLIVMSPFGNNEDIWFTRVLENECMKNQKLGEVIDLFIASAREDLVDKYAFNNELNIDLFKRFPQISNYPEFADLKHEIEYLKRAENRILDGDEDYDTIFLRSQKVIESLLRHVILRIVDIEDTIKNINRYDFKYQIDQISTELGVAKPKWKSEKLCSAIISDVSRKKAFGVKENALFLLLDAYFRNNSQSLVMLKAMPEFYNSIHYITELRNENSHSNISSDDFLKDYSSEVKSVLTLVNDIAALLISNYLGGQANV